MSLRYSACLSFSSPNMRSFSTSEKPMMALSGVRSSCDMLARNSDLCRLATSSCAALVRDLPKEPGVLDRQGGLGGEGLENLDGLRREFAGRVPVQRQAADDLSLAEQGHGEQRPVAGAQQRVPDMALVGARHRDVRDLGRLAGLRRAAHRALRLCGAATRARSRQGRGRGCASPECGTPRSLRHTRRWRSRPPPRAGSRGRRWSGARSRHPASSSPLG